MSVEVREATLAEPELLEAWHGVMSRADRYGREVATPWTLAEIRVALATPDPRSENLYLVGLADGTPVSAATIGWPLLDNPDLALVQVYVDPPARRCGHGRALLAEVERRCRERGRTLVVGEAQWPYGLGADGQDWAGAAFARAHGYELALGDVQRRLALPVDEALLAELAAIAAPHHAEYTLRQVVGPVPDDLLEAYALLDAAVETEAPTGDLVLEPAAPDVAAVRVQNDRLVGQRRTRCVTFAFRGDEPAGFTELVVVGHEPGRVYQWGTLVRREHRGHRLGLAVKVANLALLQREVPGPTHVLTWNAEVNDHMIGINDALGFVPVGRMGEFQKRL